MKLHETSDGSHTIFSNDFGVTYHSIHGAIQETQHVFIDAGFRQKAAAKQLDILDIGFGTGLNAFMTYLDAQAQTLPTNYVGIEAFPVPKELVEQLNYAELLGVPSKREVLLSMHAVTWGTPQQLSENFTFTKRKMRFEEIDYKAAFDLIYFDAFGPEDQPELWEENVLGKMYNALRKDGILVTYCAKGVVKRCLKRLGFTVEGIKGPPGKREMTRAMK